MSLIGVQHMMHACMLACLQACRLAGLQACRLAGLQYASDAFHSAHTGLPNMAGLRSSFVLRAGPVGRAVEALYWGTRAGTGEWHLPETR